MSQSSVQPRLLSSDRQRGGELHVQVRLADGSTAWAIMPAGDLGEALLAELAPALLVRLVPDARVAGQPAGIPARQPVGIAAADPR